MELIIPLILLKDLGDLEEHLISQLKLIFNFGL